ncbi:hypothetical protein [Achromobacter anxifer]
MSMDVIEFDEKIPSIKIAVNLAVEKFGRSVSVNMTCWVECAVFDLFIDSLKNDKTASIKDMSDEFFISVDVERNGFVWSCSSADFNGNVMKAEGEESLADDAKGMILTAFESFPKWW